MKLLLINGADINSRDTQGATAMMMASAAGQSQVAAWLQKLSSQSQQETGQVTDFKSKGEYATIDVKHSMEMMTALTQGSDERKQAAIKEVAAAPGQFNPAVFYALSYALFHEGKKDDGALWFYAGQLRARFDANRCNDVSARQAVGALNQSYGPQINQYMFQDIPKLKKCLERVMEWDRNTPYNYDHRWINLHGMRAMISALDDTKEDASSEPLSMPKEKWGKIAEKTRVDYLKGFKSAWEELKMREP